MEFRLVYEGPLRAAGSNTRSAEKHEIRKQLHKQLANLWRAIPNLNIRTAEHSILQAPPSRLDKEGRRTVTMAAAIGQKSLLETLGQQFDIAGFKFVPLVCKHLKLSCGLDILFLRRDMPGAVIHSGGDLDNRLKVLFDALRVPADNELAGVKKDAAEEPYFFCLMEDDALITEVAVTTDTLLTPCDEGNENDIHLVIKVKVRPTEFSFENLAFAT